mgnify:CR=1 FL=1
MAAKQYSLAPSTWGAGVEIPVDHVSQAALFSDFAGRKGTTYVDVVLEANPLNRSWRVRRRSGGELPGPVLGEVAPGEREDVEALVRREMGAAIDLGDVPLDVSIGTGHSWHDAAH